MVSDITFLIFAVNFITHTKLHCIAYKCSPLAKLLAGRRKTVSPPPPADLAAIKSAGGGLCRGKVRRGAEQFSAGAIFWEAVLYCYTGAGGRQRQLPPKMVILPLLARVA